LKLMLKVHAVVIPWKNLLRGLLKRVHRCGMAGVWSFTAGWLLLNRRNESLDWIGSSRFTLA